MKLNMTNQMRLEQQMKLAPRMIQSMEILQLSTLALLEKIEQELKRNPVLEIDEPAGESNAQQDTETKTSEEKDLVSNRDENKADDFERLSDFADHADDHLTRAEVARNSQYSQ